MRIKNPKWLILLFLLFVGTTVEAQVKVTGIVTDDNKEILPGVSITVRGAKIGTTTNANGAFELSVPDKKSILVFSFVGYKTQERLVGNNRSLKVMLEEEAQSLDEVVISAGYTEVKRRDFTGAAGKADMNEIMKTPVVRFDQALQGRIAGVNISSNEGGPNGTFNIVIRGNNSLTQSNSPLFVIDGFPSESSNASSINPSDIESIDVLKDASATAIYGARGANGVIIITTKRGAIGKPTVTYNGSVSFEKLNNKLELMDAYEFVRLQTEIRTASEMSTTYFSPVTEGGANRTLEDYKNVKGYDWQDEIFRTAVTQNHYVALTGGREDTRYSASLSYTNQDGIILNSNFERYQGRFSLDQKINDKFRFTANANYTRSITSGASPSSTTSSATSNLMYSVWGYRPVTWDDTDLKTALYDPDVDSSNDYRFNPILSLKEEYRKNKEDNLAVNGAIEYTIIPGLKAKFSGGYRYRNLVSESFNNSKTRYGNATRSEGVNASMRTTDYRTWLNENTITYAKTFNKVHNFTALAGITFQSDKSSQYYAYVQNMTNEALGMSGLDEGTPTTTTSAMSESKLMSYLGRVTYNYDNKYYLTASFRSDGSSKFASNHRWGYFPSAAAAWTFSREEFMKDKSWLTNGKLRLSWGLTGNNRVSDFASLAQMYSGKDVEYDFANNYSTGYVISSIANKKLKWETTSQFNAGVDLSFFNDRIALTVDAYTKTTKDLLLYADLPRTSGFSSAYKNIGKMRNRGLEFTLQTTNIKTKTFMWTSNFNISFNRGKILSLNDGQETMLSTVSFDNGYNTPSYIAQVGKQPGLMYGYAYDGTYKYDDFDQSGSTYTLKATVPNNGNERSTIKPGGAKYKDINKDGVVNSYDRVVIGNGNPIHTGGFTNTFSYKNFDLSIFFQWSYGNDIMNANRLIFENGNQNKDTNRFASYAKRWTSDNPDSNIPAVRGQGPSVFSSRVVEDGSYLRLKNVSLSYTFPSKSLRKIGLSTARIYVSGENLITFTSYSGYDPEVSTRNSALTPGFDYSAYPRAYNFSVGLNLGF